MAVHISWLCGMHQHYWFRMFYAASNAAISTENANATENIFPGSSIGGCSFEPAAIILLCIWLSVEDVLTGVDMIILMNYEV
ncbi:hypothetical protein Tco_0530805 [Tanacetum coccineum]